MNSSQSSPTRRPVVRIVALGAAALALLGAAEGCRRSGPISITWRSNATQYRRQTGRSVTVSCPANGTLAGVWGTDVYSDDSSICSAAVHAGRITQAAGGVVTVYIHPGFPGYVGSARNGVTTFNYGRWSGSFAFTPTVVPPVVPAGMGNNPGGLLGGLIGQINSQIGSAATAMGTAVNSANAQMASAASAMGTATNIANAQMASAASAMAAAPGVAVPTTWEANATAFRGQNGVAHTVLCPPSGPAGQIWGTDVYTDDSSVCTAAVHAGRITQATGGPVTFYSQPGQPAYAGSARNGVTSQNYPEYSGSFTFTPTVPGTIAAPPPSGPQTLAWGDAATQFRGRNGQSIAVVCPPGGPAGSIWGSGPYTDDSSICTAAVHAGRIQVATGGAVTITIAPGMPAYQGTTANGVTSSNYGAYAGSFMVN